VLAGQDARRVRIRGLVPQSEQPEGERFFLIVTVVVTVGRRARGEAGADAIRRDGLTEGDFQQDITRRSILSRPNPPCPVASGEFQGEGLQVLSFPFRGGGNISSSSSSWIATGSRGRDERRGIRFIPGGLLAEALVVAAVLLLLLGIRRTVARNQGKQSKEERQRTQSHTRYLHRGAGSKALQRFETF